LAVDADGRPVPRFPVRVVVPAGQTAVMSAQGRAVLDGGSEAPAEAPLGAEVPEILGWSPSLDAGQVLVPGPARLPEGEHTLWVWVTQPADTAVTVVLAIEKD